MAADTMRWRALGGVAGPVGLIGAWAALGTGRAGYSPVRDQVSQLAAVGASSRPAMTLGFVAFGAGVLAFATAARSGLGRGVGRAAAASAVATLGVAALPLGSGAGDGVHGAAAAVAYATLVATPLVAAAALAGQGRRVAAAVSVGVGVASASALVASVLVTDRVGLWQRVGLCLGDSWLMAAGLWLAVRRP